MRRPVSLIRLIVVCIAVFTVLPIYRPSGSVALAVQAVPSEGALVDPAASAKTTGRKVLENIISEGADFRAHLTINGPQPSLKEWATCALASVDNKRPDPIWYPINNDGNIVESNWNCAVTFVNGRTSSARINLYDGTIRRVIVATIGGNTKSMRAAFIKETLCTRLALEGNLIDGRLYKAMHEKTRMNERQIVEKLATYIDGLAVYCLPPAERQALGVPKYVPLDDMGPNLCKAIDRLSREGYIRPGGLGQFLKVCGQ